MPTPKWSNRPAEERNLLNPGFCATLLWYATSEYQNQSDPSQPDKIGLSLELSFFVLPFVLRGDTRRALPGNIRTSLAVWLDSNPIQRSMVATGAIALRPFTREAIVFGSSSHLIEIRERRLTTDFTAKRKVNFLLKNTTQEVRECCSRAEFIGRWLYENGSPQTIMALMGVRA